MNQINITGNLARDIEVRTTSKGTAVANGVVAVDRAIKDKDGNRVTDFISFAAWDKKAEYLRNYASKGDRLEISGRLESKRVSQDGMDRTYWEVVVEQVQVIAKKDRPREETPQEEPEEEELPF